MFLESGPHYPDRNDTSVPKGTEPALQPNPPYEKSPLLERQVESLDRGTFYANAANAEKYNSFQEQAKTESLGYDKIREILRLLGIPLGSNGFDLGCGSGHFTKRLTEDGYQMIGIDTSPEMAALAQTKGGSLLDSTKELPGESFQFGVATFVLCDMDRDTLQANAQEITRVLCSGGVFITLQTNYEQLIQTGSSFTSFRVNPQQVEIGGDVKVELLQENGEYLSITDHYWTEEVYSDVFSQAGLTVEEVVLVSEQGRELAPFKIMVVRKQ